MFPITSPVESASSLSVDAIVGVRGPATDEFVAVERGGVATPRTIRALHVINGEHYSGAERVQDLLACELPGCQVEVEFACVKPGKFPDLRRCVDTPLHKLTMAHKFDLRAVRELASLVRAGGFDLLHAHFGPASTYALGPAALLDLPLVVTYHGYDVPFLMTNERMRPRYWRYWAMSRWMLRRVDRFLPASDELARMLIELGAPPERVHVWRLGVTIPPQWSPRPLHDAPRILMIGRFVEKKGFDIGIRAFARVATRCPGAVLQIICLLYTSPSPRD